MPLFSCLIALAKARLSTILNRYGGREHFPFLMFRCIHNGHQYTYSSRHREFGVWVNSYTGQLRSIPIERFNQNSGQTATVEGWGHVQVQGMCSQTAQGCYFEETTLSPNNQSIIMRPNFPEPLQLQTHLAKLFQYCVTFLIVFQTLEEESVRWVLWALGSPHVRVLSLVQTLAALPPQQHKHNEFFIFQWWSTHCMHMRINTPLLKAEKHSLGTHTMLSWV